MSDLIPEAIYKSRATAIGIETTSTGKEYVSADFPVTIDGEELTIEWRGWLTDKAMERTIESLRFMGWFGDDVYQLARDGALRNEVNIDVRHEEYKGKTTARVSFVNEVRDLDPAAEEKKKTALAEKFKKLAAKSKPAVPPPDPKDDLPF